MAEADDHTPPDFVAEVLNMKSPKEIEALRKQVMPLILSDKPILNPFEIAPYKFNDAERDELLSSFPDGISSDQSRVFLEKTGLAINIAKRLKESQDKKLSNREIREHLKALRDSAKKTYELFLDLPPSLHKYIDIGLQKLWNERCDSMEHDAALFVRRMGDHYSDVTFNWIDLLISQLADLILALDSVEDRLRKSTGGKWANIAMVHLAFRVAEAYHDCFDQMPTATEGKHFELILETIAGIADVKQDQEASVMGYVTRAVSQLKTSAKPRQHD